MYESELELQVYVTHTPIRTETIERYMPVDYKPNGGRKMKGQEYYTLQQYELAEQTKRKSLANSKRNLQGIIRANYTGDFCLLTLTYSPSCDFDITNFKTCRNKFNLFWKNLKRSKKLANVDVRYIGVIEFQLNGHIHFHVLCHIPQKFEALLKSKWKYGGLHYEQSHGTPNDNPKIASYLSKGIYDERLPLGKKRYLGGYGLERPRRLKFKSRKIIDYLEQRNGEILRTFESPNGFTSTILTTDATISELEQLAEAENLDLTIESLEGLQSIQYTFNEK